MLINGTPRGLNGNICCGGHSTPSSVSDALLLCTKVQKKERKNITSDVIKRIIPIFNPFFTNVLWDPLFEDSRSVSRHQRVDSITVNKIDGNTVK